MRPETRLAFNAFTTTLASINGVPSATEKFTVSPSVEQKLEQRIQESSDFLRNVNSYGVRDLQGEKIGLSIASTIASRTDTTSKDRQAIDPTALGDLKYECKQTNFDTALRYAKLDQWSKFPNFQKMIRNAIIEQMGRDRLIIGFNGQSAAADTNRANNPLLQDVNIGWLKKLETNAAARYLKQGGVANKVCVGAGGDFANLDELVYSMRSDLLQPWHARDNSLIACCSADLLDEKYFPLIAANAEKPLENEALNRMLAAKKLGGLAPAEIPFFPERTIFITRLAAQGGSNLSIYWQEGSRRRTIVDNAKRDQIEDYQSVNEAYEIEDYGCACAATNIVFPDGNGGWV